MRVPRCWLLGFLVAGVTTASAAEGRWEDLFNGRDLSGWIQRGGNASYRVEDRAVVGRAVAKTPNSFLCTERVFTNFVLELEFRVATNLNSGVQIRSECFPEAKELKLGDKVQTIPAGRVHGYQVEIDPSPRAWTAGIYDEGRRGWLNDLRSNDAARRAFRAHDWNQLRVEARGASIKTWLNGVAAADLKDAMTPSGLIGLQVHGVSDKDVGAEVRWRRIRIQELP